MDVDLKKIDNGTLDICYFGDDGFFYRMDSTGVGVQVNSSFV